MQRAYRLWRRPFVYIGLFGVATVTFVKSNELILEIVYIFLLEWADEQNIKEMLTPKFGILY